MPKIDASTPYRPALSNWATKVCAGKPTVAQFEAANALVQTPGKQSLAIAMSLRDCGVTAGQMKAACIGGWGNSGAHLNKMNDLRKAGYLRELDAPKTASNHKVYRHELTAKGQAKVAAYVAAHAAAVEVKPAKAAKPRKVKAVKALPAPAAPEAPAAQ